MTELTLADFLLARLAEDEAPTWRFARYVCPPGCCAPAGWVGSQCLYCDAAPVYGGTVKAMTEIAERHAEDIHQRSRVLADVAAKRRIIELHRPSTAENHTRGDPYCVGCWEAGGEDGAPLHPCDTLRLLALPYAEHPDYRKGWRP